MGGTPVHLGLDARRAPTLKAEVEASEVYYNCALAAGPSVVVEISDSELMLRLRDPVLRSLHGGCDGAG